MRPRFSGAVLGLAGFGLAMGHLLTYTFDVPDAHERAQVLAQTGHGYLPVATQFAVVAGVAGFAIVILGRLVRRDHVWSAGSTFVWLAGFQVGAFVAMEVLERSASGASVAHLLHGSILPVGMLVQLTMAAGGVVLLRLLLRAADRIADHSEAASLPRPTLAWRLPFARQLGLVTGALGAAHIRGPPPLLPH
jgi:hypothetical protein